MNQGKPAEAMATYEQSRVIGERLLHARPDSADFACCLSGARNNMAVIDIDAKRFEEAHARLREAIAVQKKAPATAPEHPACLANLKFHLTLLIKTATGLGRAEDAAEARRDVDDLKARGPR